MSETARGLIFNKVQGSFVDGWGIRTTIFLKGCPLTCKWCCNPEGQSFAPELKVTYSKCDGCGRCEALCPQKALTVKDGRVVIDRSACDVCGQCADFCWTGALEPFGRYYTVDEMFEFLQRDTAFYASSGGGVTIGGGEATWHPAFVLPLMEKLHGAGIHVAIDTCGYVDTPDGLQVLKNADLLLFDIKGMDPVRHKENTGVSNELIWRNLRMLGEMGKDNVKDLGNGVTLIEDSVVHMFLVRGKKRALLIDTGFGQGDLHALIKTLWTGPLFVLNTHSHIDHVGADGQFFSIMAHPSDWKQICEHSGLAEEKLVPIGEGTRIDLGGRELHIYETPGHTPGSVVLLEPASRLLFGGDNVADKPIFLCLEGSSVEQYLQSLYRLQELACRYDIIYASHGTVFQKKAQIQALIDCCQAYLQGNLNGIPSEPYENIPRILYQLGTASFFVAAHDQANIL